MTVEPQPVARGKGTSLLVYGLPGSGKTRLAATGSETLIIRPPTDHTDSVPVDADVEELVVDDWSRMLEVFQWGQQGGFKNYEWVWLDSISLMQDHLLSDVMADTLARRPDLALDKGGVKVPKFGFDQQEYKINFDRLVAWVRDMNGLADAGVMNFGITAHPFEWHDPVLEEDVWAPWIQGRNMSPKICGYMNIVAYLQVQKRKDGEAQQLLLTDSPGFVGKDQYHCFPELKSGKRGILDPTMTKIEKAIKTARGGSRRRAKKRPARKR